MPAKSMQGKTDSLPSHSEGADLSASKYNQQDVAETAGVGHATCAVDHDVDSYHRVLTVSMSSRSWIEGNSISFFSTVSDG
eukprot:scaffold25896_cov22-Tisochrysis_lutea.AAC.1